jgi:inosose dehydratase
VGGDAREGAVVVTEAAAPPAGQLRIGNAPCSWGVLEFDAFAPTPVGYAQMLDELVATGYTGTELGDWGFMPTNPALLRHELTQRDVVMIGAFVPVALRDPATHAPGATTAVRVARLLAAVTDATEAVQPVIVLADDNGTDPTRTRFAGRIIPAMGLSADAWRTFADGAMHVARAVREATGIRTVFHPHCAGWVETPDEIARLLDLTDPDLLALCFDTGHITFAGGDPVTCLRQFSGRLGHVHFKDCDPNVAARVRANEQDYLTAVREGVFCELGKGAVDFPGTLRHLREMNYRGWGVVEQDVLPGMGTPAESARRNRHYLTEVGA